jgi:hypothetical protein
MAVHALSMRERTDKEVRIADPAECRAHFAAGRLPVYLGRRLVAYVDRPDDLPEARFVERDGRLTGVLDVWDVPAKDISTLGIAAPVCTSTEAGRHS